MSTPESKAFGNEKCVGQNDLSLKVTFGDRVGDQEQGGGTVWLAGGGGGRPGGGGGGCLLKRSIRKGDLQR